PGGGALGSSRTLEGTISNTGHLHVCFIQSESINTQNALLISSNLNLLFLKIVALNKTKERMRPYHVYHENDDPDIKKIKKVQSFMRGWLCRRKWKIIVQDYICSPHAESMRKRNQIVFNMVEAETEYVHQLYILVNCFLRPLRMAASSKKPPISHDDVSSIFLNSETIMFLHEIFHQGLKARIANWPTLVLADLFDILLPMLNIYQEFVRNHQYSLQVLANCKQNRDFDKLLKQYESNAACEGRMLETFLTYPMFQIPRYIITLHELLAHTPHEHVERKSLEFAKSKLEELSRVMHDEVSDTENIRKNLAIERMIVEGCDILLDTSQTFVRQGESSSSAGALREDLQQQAWSPQSLKHVKLNISRLLSPIWVRVAGAVSQLGSSRPSSPRPLQRCIFSNLSWVDQGASCRQDMPETPSWGGVQEASKQINQSHQRYFINPRGKLEFQYTQFRDQTYMGKTHDKSW
uniref:DH domain-containing protein n=1 Tax=Nothobranchius furzeri TaxID=105023 RepID=A0A8C6LQ45_NOTFU